jgi:D-3-phosphoglycerate dehydrogenase
MILPAKVLFIDSTHPILVEELERSGLDCDLRPGLTYESYREIVPAYTGVIVRSGITLDKDFLSKAAKLRFIGRVGAGLENIDVEYAEKNGIICLNAPEGNRDALAEHTVGMLLSLFNNLNRADREVRKGIWNREQNRGIEIMGKTVGIIGYGNMGSAFAGRLSGFGLRVIAYDKYKHNYADGFCEECSLEELMNESDIVSLHVPLTEETTWMADDRFMNSFRKAFWLINTSRGKVVRTSDLLNNLDSGQVRGAVLDVLEFEDRSLELETMKLPETFFRLAQYENVILSPHIAGWTQESKFKLAKVLADKIKNEFGL